MQKAPGISPELFNCDLSLSDWADRTYCLASTAINATSLVNHILGVSLGDHTDGTFTGAAATADASIRNSACHNYFLLDSSKTTASLLFPIS